MHYLPCALFLVSTRAATREAHATLMACLPASACTEGCRIARVRLSSAASAHLLTLASMATLTRVPPLCSAQRINALLCIDLQQDLCRSCSCFVVLHTPTSKLAILQLLACRGTTCTRDVLRLRRTFTLAHSPVTSPSGTYSGAAPVALCQLFALCLVMRKLQAKCSPGSRPCSGQCQRPCS